MRKEKCIVCGRDIIIREDQIRACEECNWYKKDKEKIEQNAEKTEG